MLYGQLWVIRGGRRASQAGPCCLLSRGADGFWRASRDGSVHLLTCLAQCVWCATELRPAAKPDGPVAVVVVGVASRPARHMATSDARYEANDPETGAYFKVRAAVRSAGCVHPDPGAARRLFVISSSVRS